MRFRCRTPPFFLGVPFPPSRSSRRSRAPCRGQKALKDGRGSAPLPFPSRCSSSLALPTFTATLPRGGGNGRWPGGQCAKGGGAPLYPLLRARPCPCPWPWPWSCCRLNRHSRRPNLVLLLR